MIDEFLAMPITPDDDTFELLTPSVALLPVLTGLRSALARLSDIKTPTTSEAWDSLPVCEMSAHIARYTLWTDGYDMGEICTEDSQVQNDINHRLMTDYEIMSPEDLSERFHLILNRAAVTRRYRRIAETPDITRLFKDSRALGWQGFDVVRASETEKRLIRNRRMFVDYFRQDFDWTKLRAIELSEAAALIEYALAGDMMSREALEPYACRIATEAMTRYDSWNAFAGAILIARTFQSLDDGELSSLQQIGPNEKRLLNLLASPWSETPWPSFAS